MTATGSPSRTTTAARVLRDPRWLAGLAVAVVFALVCVWLAQWQLDRRVARAERNAAVLENYDSAAGRFSDVVPDLDAPLGVAGEWQPVAVRGSYDPDGTVLVRNRPQGGSNGYLVATPFEVADAGATATVLVVRGWLPSGTDASSPGAVPDPPPGPVDLVVRLRAGEEPSGRAAPEGQTYRLHVPTLLTGSGRPADPFLSTAYGVLATEQGAPPSGVVPVPRPDTDPGPHLAYGVQWYLFALAGLGIWFVLARRHAGEQADDEQRAASGPDGPAGAVDPPPVAGSAAGRSTAARDGWVYDPGR